MNKNKEFVSMILANDVMKNVIAELGLEKDSPEKQANAIEMVGETIMQRLILEALKVLPSEKHDAFEAFMGGGDLAGLQEFLAPHIPDLDSFVEEHARREYEAILQSIRSK